MIYNINDYNKLRTKIIESRIREGKILFTNEPIILKFDATLIRTTKSTTEYFPNLKYQSLNYRE